MLFPAEIAFHTMYNIGQGGARIHGEGVPDDVHLLGYRWNQEHATLELLVESEAFERYNGEEGFEPVHHWKITITNDKAPPPVDYDAENLVVFPERGSAAN